MWLVFIIGLIIGVIIASIAIKIRSQHATVGTLHLETSDPDGQYLFLELTQNGLNEIHRQKYVTLKVDTKSYISQK